MPSHWSHKRDNLFHFLIPNLCLGVLKTRLPYTVRAGEVYTESLWTFNKRSMVLQVLRAGKYRITAKFGGSFDLANLTVDRQIKVFRWMQRQCCSSHAWDAKLKPANYVQMAHSSNIILAKFSRYSRTSLIRTSLIRNLANPDKTVNWKRGGAVSRIDYCACAI